MVNRGHMSFIAKLCFVVGCLLLFSLATIGGASAQNPVPLINQPLVPDCAKPGGAGFTLTVNGTGFVSGAVVKWNGSALATTFESSSQLKATILSSDIAEAGTASVTVVNPAPGGGTSNVAFFEVTALSSSIALSAPTIFSVDSSSIPNFVTVGDFNGDGKPDLAVAGDTSNNVSVFLGNGDGTFRTVVNYAAGTEPSSVAVGDFNADGKPDLAVANFGSNNVSVFLGNGDGTFQSAGNYAAGSAPISVAVGDFNRDGKPDLVVANQATGNNVSVLLGNGDGTFQAPVNYAAGSFPQSVAVGDFNRDDKLDLAVSNSNSNDVSVLLGNGDGTFQAPVNYAAVSTPKSVAVGDFNGDGNPDLVVANFGSNNVSVFLGNGDGTFQAAVNYAAGSIPASVAVGDFNGDGKLDLAVSSSNISVLLGNGDGTFQAPVNFAAVSTSFSVAVGDFNGDGRLDLAASLGGGVGVLLQAPTVSLSKTSLTFANQVIGTSSPSQTVTLTNTSTLTLTISSIVVTGTNTSDLDQINTCDTGVPPGGRCTITITFAPTQIGPRTASVTITDNAVGTPQEIALSGTGVVSGPNATLSTASLTFATEPVLATSPAQSVTLSNYGTATLAITSIATSGDFNQTHTCGSSLAVLASCTMSVTFTPTLQGSRAGALSITDDAPGSPQNVSLSGTGTLVTAVELSPSSLNFGYHALNTWHYLSTTLTNFSGNTLSITGITITGASDEFRLFSNTCGFSVGPGASCTLWVSFRPTESGTDGATLSIIDNGTGSPQTVTLSGAGCLPFHRCN